MKKHNLAFIDTETTGFNPDTQELIQIGCVIMEQDWSTGKCVLKHVDEFELKIKPEHIETADAQALRVNGYEPADWIFAYTLKEAMQIFAEKTKDTIFVAHNACFDYMFIEKAFRLAGVKNEMHYHKLDTISIAFAKFHNTDDVDKFSLRNLCEYFKIENKNAHTALSDARALAEVYEKLMQLK
jgi:DNA polymerase III epsilon subunit-like protein